jgi:hypothetical protein
MCHYESWQRHCTKVSEPLSKYCSASMRCAVVSIVIALAFAPQAFAVLRPLFPVKPEPPFSGEPIVIRDDLVRKTNSTVVDARVTDRATTRTAAALSCSLEWGMRRTSRRTLIERRRNSLTGCGKRGRNTKPNNRQKAASKTGISNKA